MILAGSFWSTAVLRVGDRTYAWRDVALFAMAAGEWPAFEARLRQGLACVAEADRVDAWPAAGALDEAATAFRYERDLLTSEETEAWLAREGLTIDSWSDALMRDVLRAQWQPRLAELDPGTLDPAALDEATLIAEGVCSGTFARWASMLGARAALAATVDAPTPASAEVDALWTASTPWLAGLDGARATLQHLMSVVAADRAAVAAALTPEALEAHVERSRLDWVRVDVECLTLPTEEAAREAVWCVREDGLSLSEVAIESRQPIVDRRAVLDALPAPLRDVVLSASPGDTVGPVSLPEGPTLVHVVAKAPATLEDPLVRARAEASVVDTARDRALVSHVQWLVPRPV